MALARQSTGTRTNTPTPSRLVMSDGNVYNKTFSQGTSGRPTHMVSGSSQPIAKSNNSIGRSVGGANRQAEVKTILSGVKRTNAQAPDAGINPPTVAETYSAPSYSGGTDDIINQIKALLNESRKPKPINTIRPCMNSRLHRTNRTGKPTIEIRLTRNYMRGLTLPYRLYGDSSNLWTGHSNMARNYQNWQSNLASARQNRTNNDATALSQLNMNKANTASTLAQGWYNYVLPVYTNRQQTLDDYDYRRYLASL